MTARKHLHWLSIKARIDFKILVLAWKYTDRISMTTVRKHLHWLPIKARIDFKKLVLAWKVYKGIGPKYLNYLLDKKTHNTQYLFTNTNLLKIPATKLVTFGAFQKAAPTL